MLHQNHSEVRDWGLVDYQEACRRQEELFTAKLTALTPDVIVAVRHPPTISLGRHAPAGDVLTDDAVLAERGVTVARSDRGGRATVHGPGQAVVYPIVDIAALKLGARAWVSLLEDAIKEVLQRYGISARCKAGSPGLWTDKGKIASIGLRIRRGISTHGLSVNVGLDVGPFSDIVTCGVPGQPVTTVSAETTTAVDVETISQLLCAELKERIDQRRH